MSQNIVLQAFIDDYSMSIPLRTSSENSTTFDGDDNPYTKNLPLHPCAVYPRYIIMTSLVDIY